MRSVFGWKLVIGSDACVGRPIQVEDRLYTSQT